MVLVLIRVSSFPSTILNRGRVLSVLLVLALMLHGAGCISAPDTVQGAEVTSMPEGRGAETCSFDLLKEEISEHLAGGDACYFRTHSPIDFLDDLRRHPETPVMVIDVPDGWITLADAERLMQEIDSTEPAAPVVSPISSYYPFNQTSTVGNEALFLLEGYRTGSYPPALCSVDYFEPNRTEVRSWWGSYGKWGIPDAREAVRIVQESHPELLAYPSDSLPPGSIRTERSPEGWYVAFIQEGSGLPILSAECFLVRNDRNVTYSGVVNRSIMVPLDRFSPKECG